MKDDLINYQSDRIKALVNQVRVIYLPDNKRFLKGWLKSYSSKG